MFSTESAKENKTKIVPLNLYVCVETQFENCFVFRMIFSIKNSRLEARRPSSSYGFAAALVGHLWQLLYIKFAPVKWGLSFCPPSKI